MILWPLVITFTNSFGIKVSTFHLYHLKLERQSSSPASQVTRHNAEREREEKRSDQGRKRDPWDQTLSKGSFVIRFCELS